MASFRVWQRWSKQIREKKTGGTERGERTRKRPEGRGHAHARAAVTNSSS